jgi:phospholipid/cholesterol/gamma-HCH transport system ATP-binding protein
MSDALIQIENVHKKFGGQPVLEGVDTSIKRGESVVILGRSGCGKSVLLKHIIRLLEPDRGRVIFDGDDVSSLRGKQLVLMRRRIGMLFQSAALFDSMTVAENVGLGLKEAREYRPREIVDMVHEKLAMVGLEDAADKEPAQLSGGMRKRAGLARAIVGDPDVLLYDEPTTGLDPVTAEKIDELIVELNTRLNVTSIAVTHDMKSAVTIARRIVMLHDGGISFDGTPDEMRTSDDASVRAFLQSSGVIHGGTD